MFVYEMVGNCFLKFIKVCCFVEEKEQKIRKFVIEIDMDVFDVCVFDEELWLNEEEDGRSQKDFIEEDELEMEDSGNIKDVVDREEEVMEEVDMEVDEVFDGENRIEVIQ